MLKISAAKHYGLALLLISLMNLSGCGQQRGIVGIGSDPAPIPPSQPTQTQIQPPYQPTSAVQATSAPPSQQGNQIMNSYQGSYALLIGQSRYTNGWDNLGSIPGELLLVKDLLISKGFQVEMASNLNAVQLSQRFNGFINRYGLNENNRLLFFYSGHGHTRKDKGYIVPTDAPNPNLNETGFLEKALSMNQIMTWARKIEAKHALFLFDSCFSGTVFKAKSLPKMPSQISEMAKLPVRQFITAGSAEEMVPANSVFTPILIDGLRYGLADLYKDGYVTGEELGLYLKHKVPQHANQTPQFGKISDYKLSRGDFVFAVGGSGPPPVQASPPPATVPKADSDQDGVADDQDNCPRNSKAEIAQGVYKTGPQLGCPLDSDQDRVADYQDRCQYNQPAEIALGVDSSGCPIDKDRDGIADYQDRCPRNQSNELRQGIDRQGCPLDRDRDRVADYQDDCLGTPAGTKVDNSGCQLIVPPSRPPRPTTDNLAAMSHGTVFRDRLADGSEGPAMVVIRAGRFRMGDIQGGGESDEQPVHEVSVNQFAMGRYEVTFAEYDKFSDATGRKKPDDRGWGRGNRPVVNVSWGDATAYTNWLSQQTGHTYRLPTEAQWEYAARAGTTTSRYWGNDPNDACRYANVHDNTSKKKNGYSWTHHNCTDGYAKTAPVGSFKSNAFALFDMLGNVREWTCSEFQAPYAGKEQRCANGGSRLAFRGGSWNYEPRNVRAAYRYGNSVDTRGDFVGFRLARSS